MIQQPNVESFFHASPNTISYLIWDDVTWIEGNLSLVPRASDKAKQQP